MTKTCPRSPARSCAWPLTTTLGVLLFAAPTLAQEIAVLPIAQEGGTAETAFGVETVLRAEVKDNTGKAVMARDVITAHMASARSLDIVCGPTDGSCLKQVGELAGVKELVIPDIKAYSAGEVLLSLGVVNVASGTFVGRSEGRVRLEMAARQADVRALVRAAYGLPAEAVTELPTDNGNSGELTTTEELGSAEVPQPPDEADPLGLVVLAAGGGLAAVGVVLGVVGAGFYLAGFLNATSKGSYAKRYSFATTTSALTYGVGGLGGALFAAGAASAAVGGVLFAIEEME